MEEEPVYTAEEPISDGITTRIIEVPSTVSIQDKILVLNIYLKEIQNEGYNILSTRPYGDGAFLIEVRLQG